jgi:hypothetical protein
MNPSYELRSLAISCALSSAFALGGCSVERGDGRPASGGQAITCGASKPVDVSNGVAVVFGDKNTFAVIASEVDPITYVSSIAGTSYKCTCNASTGQCYPSLDGMGGVSCVPAGCSGENGGDCTLNESGVASFDMIKATLRQKSCKEDAPQSTAIRAAQLGKWIATNGFPAPEFSKDGEAATAPDGHGLVAELVGGTWIVYAVPDVYFGPDGQLEAAVGPAASDEVFQMVLGGGAKCFCDQKGNRKACAFSGGTIGLCSGNCSDAEQQSQCTISTAK